MGSCPDTDIDPIVFLQPTDEWEKVRDERAQRDTNESLDTGERNLHVYFLLFFDYFHFYLSYLFPR